MSESDRLYPREQIYTLVGDEHSSENWRTELAADYEALPYNCDGIAIYETSKSEGDEDTAIIVFNGTLSNEELKAIRNSRDESLRFSSGYRNVHLTPEQKEAQQPVRSPAKFLGRLGVSGATGAGMALYVETLASAAAAPLPLMIAAGVATAGSAFQATRSPARKRELKQARQSVETLKQQCLDPEQGAITFLRDAKHYAAQPEGIENTNTPETVKELWKLLGRRSYAGLARTHGAITINPGEFIKGLLEREPQPAQSWYSYLEESARTLSALQRELLEVEHTLSYAQKVKEFTGVYDEDELDGYQDTLRTTPQQMLITAFAAVSHYREGYKERGANARLARREEIIKAAFEDTPAEPHPLEQHLQTLRSIACRPLLKLDTTDEKAVVAAERIRIYLDGTRETLREPRHIRNFYIGMCQKLKPYLPEELPAWEKVEHEFPSGASGFNL